MEFCYLLVPFPVPDLSYRLVEVMSNDILLPTTKKKKSPVCSLVFLWGPVCSIIPTLCRNHYFCINFNTTLITNLLNL